MITSLLQREHHGISAGIRVRCENMAFDVHSALRREMTSWPPYRKCDVKSKIRLRQSKPILLE